MSVTHEDEGDLRSLSSFEHDSQQYFEQFRTKTVPNTDEKTFSDKTTPPESPPLEESWKVVMHEVTSMDDGVSAGWKDDLDTLLVFAGIFSAVVTAFTIESYQWLEEAPEDITIQLLRRISQQLDNSGAVVPPPPPFELSTSVVRINVLWFLSLILSLGDALFALLCKQWLREHRQPTRTRTPQEALALLWVRKKSLDKWHVSTILSLLPLVLELALFLFLGGLVEFLRGRHPTLFVMAAFVLTVTSLFYLATTITPGLDIIRQALQVEPKFREVRTGDHKSRKYSPIDFTMSLPPLEYICPYKSPQAWLMFQGISFISGLPGVLRELYRLSRRKHFPSDGYHKDTGSTWAFNWTMSKLLNWPCVDLEILQRSNAQFVPPFHELNALRWLVGQLRENPIMLPHLQNILETLPPHLVMPGVLDGWLFPPSREWASGDIKDALQNPDRYSIGPLHDRGYFHVSLDSDRETTLFNNSLHHCHLSMSAARLPALDRLTLPRLVPQLWNQTLPGNFDTIGLIDKILTILDPATDPPNLKFVEKIPDFSNGAGSGFWRIFASIMNRGSVVDPSTSVKDVITLMDNLGRYISDASPNYSLHEREVTCTSKLVSSPSGLEFLRKLHSSIIEMGVVEQTFVQEDLRWVEAIDIVRRVHQLPMNHFERFPYYFPLSLAKLEEALRTISPLDRDIDFGYLDSYTVYWDGAYAYERVHLIQILTNHINNHPLFSPQGLEVSPLVLSSPGINLINFVNDRLSELPQSTFEVFEGQDRVVEWNKARNNMFSASLAKLGNIIRVFRPEGYEADWDSVKPLISILKYHWDGVPRSDRRLLVDLLSAHIITCYPNSRKSTDPEIPSTSLLSSEALSLVDFVNDRLVQDQDTWNRLPETSRRAWLKALERARRVHGSLTGPIPHKNNNPPGSNVPLPPEEVDQRASATLEEVDDMNGTTEQADSVMFGRFGRGWNKGLTCIVQGFRELLGYLGAIFRTGGDSNPSENLQEVDTGDRNV
ncbi:hypothetical protein PQX77_014462 [Marasmius sp. AFHP31]|nr:hypothetical protein PQX77_014462 [Marasmius sp. AFHP31]